MTDKKWSEPKNHYRIQDKSDTPIDEGGTINLSGVEIPVTFKGRSYKNAIMKAINKSRSEYDYPSSASTMGMKKILGRGLYAQLLRENLYHARIPKELKIKLIGKESYDEQKQK